MISATLESFLHNLEQSNLLSAEELAAVKAEITQAESDPQQAARRLVAERRLTAWQASHLLAGRTAFYLGKYRLLERIGEGGMGTVLKAEHATLGRTVALKVVSREFLRKPEAVARFRREIQAAAALDHPHVVRAYDADEVAGVHFLVMEYVDGAALNELVKGHGRLSVDVACECVRQAALGLEHAHEQGMVHRDIKPSNLIVSRPGTSSGTATSVSGPLPSVVKILDMGLARLTSEIGADGPITTTGQMMGTVDFMAPEQADDPHRADVPADIYALGATLVYLLTGRVLFEVSGPLQKLMARQNEPAPPLRRFRPDAPAELEAVVATMLERDPARRYRTAGAVAAALQPFCGLTAWEGDVSDEATEVDLAARPPAGLVDTENALATGTLAQTRLGDLLETTVPAATDSVAEDELTRPVTVDAEYTGMQEFLGALAHEAEQEESSLSLLEQRLQTRRRRQFVTGVVLAVLAVPLIAGWWYLATNRGTLVIQLPAGSRDKAALFVDDRRQRLDPGGVDGQNDRRTFDLRAGVHSVRLQWPGYKELEQTVTITRGGTVMLPVAERLEPTAATARRLALRALQKRVEQRTQRQEAPTADDPAVAELRRDLLAFRRRYYQSPEDCVTAARLMRRLPWPVDELKRKDIDAYELRVAERAAGEDTPLPELVAVLGTGRYKHWSEGGAWDFSPDGRTLASMGRSGTIWLWDAHTAELKRTLGAGSGYGTSIAFAPDGRTIAAYQNGLTLWDVESGEARLRINTFAKSTKPVYHLEFSPDGQRLAVPIGGFGTVLYDTATGDELGSIAEEYFQAFSPDGGHLVLTTRDGLLRIRDVATRKVVVEWEANARFAAFAPSGRLLATSGPDVKFWDPASGKELRTLQAGPGPVAFHPTKPLLASRDGNDMISLWDAESGERLRRINTHGPIRGRLLFSPDGNTLAASRENGIVLWDVASGDERFKPSGHNGTVASVAVSPDGQWIASAGNWHDGSIKVWDAASGQEILTKGHFTGRFSVAFSPDGKTLASAVGSDVVFWDFKTGQQLRRLSGHADEVFCVAFSPDGGRLASGANWHDKTVKLWDVATGRERHLLSGHTGPIHSVAFSPDGKTLASASHDGTLKLWNPETGRETLTLEGHSGRVTSVAFSPDGERLASGSEDNTIRLWDAATGRETLILRGHTGGVTSVAFSPDGKRLASAGNDGTVRLWGLQSKRIRDSTKTRLSGRLLKTFQLAPAGGAIHQVAFTPDGRHPVTANGNGTLYVLRLEAWPPAKTSEH